jgi:hypothetical protein
VEASSADEEISEAVWDALAMAGLVDDPEYELGDELEER